MTQILIVEDDVFSAKQLQNILEQHSYTVDVCLSGEHALQRIESDNLRPDIILMDIQLGEDCMDGAATTREIHRIFEVPIILHTGYSDAETFLRAVEMTKYGYVYKTPGNTQFILASLETGLKLFRTEQQLREREKQYRQLANHLQTIREEQAASIAREIHDDLGQSLAALKMNLSLLPEDETTQDMQIILDTTVNSMRALINNLRPPALDTGGFLEAIQSHVHSFYQSFHIPVEFDLQDTDILESLILPPQMELNIFRIVQESLTNAARHSCSESIMVWAGIADDTLKIQVSDRGCGFNPDSHNGFGIMSMRERAWACGGSLCIDSNAHGSTICFCLEDYQRYLQEQA